MADLADLIRQQQAFLGRDDSLTTFLINNPPPGTTNTGGIIGIVNDILQRIPIPRPRLPMPRGPSPVPTPRGRLPIPIPIPIPGGLFNGDNGCAPNPCCRGQHLNKSTDCAGNPPGTKCVSNRRMNPLNPRALKRAIRRATRFESFVKSNRKSLRKLAKI